VSSLQDEKTLYEKEASFGVRWLDTALCGGTSDEFSSESTQSAGVLPNDGPMRAVIAWIAHSRCRVGRVFEAHQQPNRWWASKTRPTLRTQSDC